MRNGQYTNNTFTIGISRLNAAEQQRLITVLQSKLGLESYTTKRGKMLSIRDPERVVRNIRPYFHSSQLSRLTRISR